MIKKKITGHPKNLILDLDGVFTDGKIYYTKDGKIMKVFGPDDHEAINSIKHLLNIHVVTADSKGFKISEKRIRYDMGLKIDLVDSIDRLNWIKERFRLDETIYMGDGIWDFLVFDKVLYSISTSNALKPTKVKADYVTEYTGGERAVAEAILHIREKFFF
jgi:3-deoxy-D-manno-octulosonate 8-phosphate phosphatase (KDO 8-P phosphatase)